MILRSKCTFVAGAIHTQADSIFVADSVSWKERRAKVEKEALLVKTRSRRVEGHDNRRLPRSICADMVSHFLMSGHVWEEDGEIERLPVIRVVLFGESWASL